jgi:anhydro-N-acetylmuramic acid kinase
LKPDCYIGIMTGTSLDGVDAVLADFSSASPCLRQTFFLPFDGSLRDELLALHHPGNDELHRTAIISNQLSHLYAKAVDGLLKSSGLASKNIVAIGCHGQTIRHCPEPEKRYTIQLGNAALLAELTGITVVADFRSRDIAAGGEGAPLVPAFHQAIFNSTHCQRVIVNIGGIANITSLEPGKAVLGFDCGPGNLLMDAWCQRHTGNVYDKNGTWAAAGEIISTLLDKLLEFQYFKLSPPKSTGRDVFNMRWLESSLFGSESPQDVQATLLQLTAQSIANAILDYCQNAEEIYVCGGGAHNGLLISCLKKALSEKKVALTNSLGVDVDWVEGYAFDWLAKQAILGLPGSLPAVTGASAERILGAVYRA